MAVITRQDVFSHERDPTHTLPYRWYTDPEIFSLELEKIFKRSWIYVGWTHEVASEGDTLTCSVANVPIVVVRGKDRTLRAFVNVCRHRAHVVVTSNARACRSLQCPYHGWTYGLDGRLVGVPRGNREPEFGRDQWQNWGLRPVRVDTHGPAIYVNLDPDAGPLSELLEPIPAWFEGSGIDVSGIDFSQLRPFGRLEWDCSANWKLVAENTLECYHCPVAHRDTVEAVAKTDPEHYRVWGDGFAVNQVPTPKDSRQRIRSIFPLLFPAQQYFAGSHPTDPKQASLAMFWWAPVSPGRTYVALDYMFHPESSQTFRDDQVAFNDAFISEDMALVSSVQVGMTSGMLEAGRILPYNEPGPQYFDRLVHDALTGA
jgi:phenylpropionate dioxygenase-like ring-hydroxylating dioxygenase large terminal subunit